VNMLRKSTAQMRLASSSLEPGLYTRKHGVVGIWRGWHERLEVESGTV
jgi:hypothetical protein